MKRVNNIEFRTTEDGSICCCSFDGNGRFVMPEPERMCDKCKQHFGTAAYAPPDPYQGLATLKAASATPESTFEDAWKRSRLEALDAERARRDAAIAAAPRVPRLTAAGLAEFTPPDPYAAGIKALQSKEPR